MGNAIVIGASSGIGRSLAGLLAAKGYRVGITGRRSEELESLRMQYPDRMHALRMDMQSIEGLEAACEALADEMGGIDLVVITAGIGILNQELDFH